MTDSRPPICFLPASCYSFWSIYASTRSLSFITRLIAHTLQMRTQQESLTDMYNLKRKYKELADQHAEQMAVLRSAEAERMHVKTYKETIASQEKVRS